jgi:hypothetical protein
MALITIIMAMVMITIMIITTIATIMRMGTPGSSIAAPIRPV